MKSIGADMRGVQYHIVLNIRFWAELNKHSCTN